MIHLLLGWDVRRWRELPGICALKPARVRAPRPDSGMLVRASASYLATVLPHRPDKSAALGATADGEIDAAAGGEA
jgi:hypothetical protein